MRPRINNFGIIKFDELDKFMYDNNCWGITVKRVSPTILKYKYIMMFRSQIYPPKEIYVTISRTSKLVIGVEIEGKKFDNIDGFKKYVSIK